MRISGLRARDSSIKTARTNKEVTFSRELENPDHPHRISREMFRLLTAQS